MGVPFCLQLTGDEALVLFEFLTRSGDFDRPTIEDQAERRALWNLQCLLEKQLPEPFQADYTGLLKAARDRLRDPDLQVDPPLG